MVAVTSDDITDEDLISEVDDLINGVGDRDKLVRHPDQEWTRGHDHTYKQCKYE